MTIIEQIQEKIPQLTRKQREVANYMLEDIDRMNYITLKEMSRETGITEMTILKTCGALGFSSFSGMKYEFRKYAAKQMEIFRHPDNEHSVPRTPVYELSDTDRLLKEICDEEAELNRRFFHSIDIKKIFAAADMMLSADKIVLCGRSVSTYICEYMATLLSALGLGGITVNTELDDSVHSTLPLITKNTLLFVVSYPDYYRMTSKMAEYVCKRRGKVLALTDSEKSPLCAFSDFTLFAPTQTRMFLNTIAAPMTMVNLIASALNIRLSSGEGNPCEKIDEFYALFQEDT